MDLKHFVTFYTNNNSKTSQVYSNEITAIKIPDHVYALRTFDRATDDIYKDGKKIVAKNETVNEKLYYIGQIVSLDQLKGSEDYQKMIDGHYIGAIKTKENILYPIPQNESFQLIPPELVGVTIIDYCSPASEM